MIVNVGGKLNETVKGSVTEIYEDTKTENVKKAVIEVYEDTKNDFISIIIFYHFCFLIASSVIIITISEIIELEIIFINILKLKSKCSMKNKHEE